MKTDLDQLIFNSLNMAEQLLIHQDGEFYPFGAIVDKDGEYRNLGIHNGNEFPLRSNLISDIRIYLEEEITNGGIRSYAISFDLPSMEG